MSVTVVYMNISKYRDVSHQCYRTYFPRRNSASIMQESCLNTPPLKGMSQTLVSNRYDPLQMEMESFDINKGSMWIIAVAWIRRGVVPCSLKT